MKPSPADQIDKELLEDWIVEQVFDAIIERQLPPGHKLSEVALGEALGVGRMHIRRSLLLLADRGVVNLYANRGAFVSKPSIEEAREVFEARIEVEPNITRMAVKRASKKDIVTLKQHLTGEHKAHIAGDRRTAIRLSGQFHLCLAEIAGNDILTKLVRELITRTSLIIGIYGSMGVSNCHYDDHQLLLTAFNGKDGEHAAELMVSHLHSIQEHLSFHSVADDGVDLVSVFAK